MEFQNGEVNKTLDLHESEIVNQAVHTFSIEQGETDKELILTNLNLHNASGWKDGIRVIQQWLVSIGIWGHLSIYAMKCCFLFVQRED